MLLLVPVKPLVALEHWIGSNVQSSLDSAAFQLRCDVTERRDSSDAHLFIQSQVGDPIVSFSGIAAPSFTESDAGKLIVVSKIGQDGAPLSSAIKRVINARTVELADRASAAVVNETGVVAYGHDESAAVMAAIGGLKAGGQLVFPAGVCGVAAPIVLPAIGRALGERHISIAGQGGGATRIVALAPMEAVFREAGVWHTQASYENLSIDGYGIADYAIDLLAGIGGRISGRNVFSNALIAEIRVGDGNRRSQGVEVEGAFLTVDAGMFGRSRRPMFNLLVNGTDSHFTDVVLAGVVEANVRDTTFGGNFYTGVHVFGPARTGFWATGSASFMNCEVDGATSIGVRFDSGGNSWFGGRLFFHRQETADVIGFQLGKYAEKNVIQSPVISDIPTINYVRQSDDAVGAADISIVGLPEPLNNGRTTQTFGLSRSGEAIVLTLDGHKPTALNTVGILASSTALHSGKITAIDIVTGQTAQWDAFWQTKRLAGGVAELMAKPRIARSLVWDAVADPELIVMPELNAVVFRARGIAGRRIRWSAVYQTNGARLERMQ
ncbi:hypothetical protein GJ654_19350 [Rhodoblastus acidophilus]|uniref:Uncharacterized protein n=1 Tax=Rhodoblastus acidophilus TaxID=1074 RepID=A0A6N8DVD2_RHOAC|nr:hypothetical protein [Rhodoblastus acidophilus]MCW2276426.1 hypothetical protein [Rhodoblastus acidophilus]MTV33143.1 hypothetical protein [Rhodoblastus acidophilus]